MPEPYDGTAVDDTTIDVVFNPQYSTLATLCDRIVQVQCVQIVADGKAVEASALGASLAYLDDTTTPDLWTVDYLDGETKPDYQQDDGQFGYKTGSVQNATMDDTPFFANDLFVSRGGKYTTITSQFLTYSWCQTGNDCPKFYEGISWTYTRSDANVQSDSDGTTTITAQNEAPLPPDFEAAFNLFNDKKNYIPCS